MKVIIVTSVGLLSQDIVEAACVVNDDEVPHALARLGPLADKLAMNVHVTSPDGLLDAINHLEDEIASAEREASSLLDDGRVYNEAASRREGIPVWEPKDKGGD